MTIDPDIAKEWPILVLFLVYTLTLIGLFYKILLDVVKSNEAFQKEQAEKWRLFAENIYKSQDGSNKVVVEQIEALASAIQSLIAEFRSHDSRTDKLLDIVAKKRSIQ